MSLMSYRRYAEHRGCSLRAVQKAIGDPDGKGQRTGRIAAALVAVEGSTHPKIDSVKADALWMLNTNEAKRSTLFTPDIAAPGGEDLFHVLPAPDVVDLDVLEEPAAGEVVMSALDSASEEVKRSYHQSRALREKINSENAQLDLDLRKGKLISLEDAKQLGFTTLRALRDSLRNIGPRVAAAVASVSDTFTCEQIINAEIDAVLASITVEMLLTDQDDDDDLATDGSEA